MDIKVIAELLQVALPTGLIVIGVWFFLTEAWPTWKERDAENRSRRDTLEHKQIETNGLVASALSLVAEHMKQPIHVVIDNDSRTER